MSRELPRVLVLTGTMGRFPRLLEALPALLEAGVAREVRVQSPDAPPAGAGLVALGLLAREALARELEGADVVVSHGGSGSCLEALALGHLPVVVARRAREGEHVDDHQADLATALEARGLAVLPADPLRVGLVEAVRHASGRRGPPRPARALGPVLRAWLDALPRARRTNATGLRVRRVAADAYEAALAGLEFVSPLQSAAWGLARAAEGWRPAAYVVGGASGPPVAAAQVLRRRPGEPAYLPYGPSMADDGHGVRGALAVLRHLARTSPTGVIWAPAWFHAARGVLARAGGHGLAPASRTGLLDLRQPDDVLRRGLRGTWRRDLEKAERDGEVTLHAEDPVLAVPAVLAEVRHLAARRGFPAPLAPEVGGRFATACAAQGGGLVAVVARAGEAVLSRYVVGVKGRLAQTLWTAGSPDPRAPGAGRRALLAAIGAARDLGATTFDLAGIDDEGNPGVASFKRGLSPTLVEVPGRAWLAPAWLPAPLARLAAGSMARGRPGGREGPGEGHGG